MSSKDKNKDLIIGPRGQGPSSRTLTLLKPIRPLNQGADSHLFLKCALSTILYQSNFEPYLQNLARQLPSPVFSLSARTLLPIHLRQSKATVLKGYGIY